MVCPFVGIGDFNIVEPGIVEIGLAMNTEHRFVGTSVDGICKVEGFFRGDNHSKTTKTVVIEIKSKVSENTAIDAQEYKTQNRIASFNLLRVSSVEFATHNELRKFIPNHDHIAQVYFYFPVSTKYCLKCMHLFCCTCFYVVAL